MNKKSFYLLFSLFLLGSCTKNPSPSSSLNSTSSSSSITSSESISSSTSSSSISSEQTEWNAVDYFNIMDVLGMDANLPFVKADSYYSYVFMSNNQKYLDLYCFTKDSTVLDTFLEDIVEDGFRVTGQNAFYVQLAKKYADFATQYITVGYLDVSNDSSGQYALNMLVHVEDLRPYIETSTSWPKEAIQYGIHGNTLPVIENESYSSLSLTNETLDTVIIFFASDKDLTNEYYALLEADGFIYNSQYEEYEKETYFETIFVYCSYDSTLQRFYIYAGTPHYVSKDPVPTYLWPEEEISAVLKGHTIPKFTSAYYEISFGQDGGWILNIYAAANNNPTLEYSEALESDGFVFAEDYQNGKIYTKTIDEITIFAYIVYSATEHLFAIQITIL